MNWTILISALFLIIVKAVYDGFKSRGWHTFSSRLETFYLAVITIVFFAWLAGLLSPFNYHYTPFLRIIGGFLLLRFAIYNPFWNIAAVQKLSFTGTTKDTDKVINWLVSKGVPMHFINYGRFIALLWGLSWLLIGEA